MADEKSVEQQAEDQVADFLGNQGNPYVDEPSEEDYEPNPEPVVEGEESEEVEAAEEVEESVEEAEEPSTVEIEYDGNIYEVPSELKDALLRQSDYTQKTQDVAAQRKAAEVLNTELEQKRALFEFAEEVNPDVLKVQGLKQQEEQLHTYLRDNVQNLSSQEIEQIRFGIEDARKQRDELVSSLKQREQEFHQAQEQVRMDLLNKGNEVLKQRIPGWGEKAQKQVRDFALSSGFTDAEVEGVLDPRQVEVLWKASQYDSLKSGAAPAVKKVQSAPKIKAKARNPMPDDVKKKLALNKKLKSKNLSASDKANLIGDDIASRFFG